MATRLETIGYEGDIKLIKGIGDVWASARIRDWSGGSENLRDVDIYLGCLGTNWKFTEELDNEVLPFSCKTGELTLTKGKKYKVSIGIQQLPMLLQGALTGNKVFLDAASGEKIMVQTSETLEVDAVTYKITFSNPTDSDDLVKIIDIYNKTTGEKWFVGSSADTSARTCVLTATSGSAPTLTFTNTESGDDIIVRYQYNRAMNTGDIKLVEDGVSFPKTFDFVLSWQVVWESGPNKGQKGYRILKANHCARTSSLELGADTGGIGGKQTIEFSVNFEDEGDIETYEGVLS